jgi:hypothetical protein
VFVDADSGSVVSDRLKKKEELDKQKETETRRKDLAGKREGQMLEEEQEKEAKKREKEKEKQEKELRMLKLEYQEALKAVREARIAQSREMAQNQWEEDERCRELEQALTRAIKQHVSKKQQFLMKQELDKAHERRDELKRQDELAGQNMTAQLGQDAEKTKGKSSKKSGKSGGAKGSNSAELSSRATRQAQKRVEVLKKDIDNRQASLLKLRSATVVKSSSKLKPAKHVEIVAPKSRERVLEAVGMGDKLDERMRTKLMKLGQKIEQEGLDAGVVGDDESQYKQLTLPRPNACKVM